MKRKLKDKMARRIGIPVLICVVILCLTSYFVSNTMVKNDAIDNLTSLTDNYAAEVDAILQRNLGFVDSIVYNLGDDVTNYPKVKTRLEYLTKNVPNNSGYYIGFEDKTYIDGSGWIPDADWDVTGEVEESVRRVGTVIEQTNNSVNLIENRLI